MNELKHKCNWDIQAMFTRIFSCCIISLMPSRVQFPIPDLKYISFIKGNIENNNSISFIVIPVLNRNISLIMIYFKMHDYNIGI